MAQERGTWRLDIIIMILYQITLVFSAQLIFVIFLDYMPQTYCTEENFCYKLNSMCLTDYDPTQKNICPESLGANRRNCIKDAKKVFFYSAQYQYQQDCTDLKIFDLSTATFIGTLLGNIVLGFLADKHGRRLIYFLSILFGIPFLVLSAFIQNVAAFYIFRVLVGFSISGTLTVGWTYATEMIAPNKRLRLLALANWPNARMIQVGLAYLAQEWKRTTYISASITCIALPILWYLPESPIWLEQKDKYEEASRARKRCQKISGSNEHHAPVHMVTFEKVTPIRIFKSSKLRTSFIVIVFMYFYVGMAVYITDLNGADMTRDLYFGQFLSGLVLSVAQFIIGMSEPCLTSLGRRVLFLASQSIAIICYILIVVCLYSDNKGSILYISAYTVAYASQSICLESAYLALVELMPTDVRATAGSVANIAMKIGTLIATLTKPLKFAYEPALFFINLVLGAVGMVIVFFFLEESRDRDLKMVGQVTKGTVMVMDLEDEPSAEISPPEPPTPSIETPKSPMTPEATGSPVTEQIPVRVESKETASTGSVEPVRSKEHIGSKETVGSKELDKKVTRKVSDRQKKLERKPKAPEVKTKSVDVSASREPVLVPLAGSQGKLSEDKVTSKNSGITRTSSLRRLKKDSSARKMSSEDVNKLGTPVAMGTEEPKERERTVEGEIAKTKSHKTFSFYDNLTK